MVKELIWFVSHSVATGYALPLNCSCSNTSGRSGEHFCYNDTSPCWSDGLGFIVTWQRKNSVSLVSRTELKQKIFFSFTQELGLRPVLTTHATMCSLWVLFFTWTGHQPCCITPSPFLFRRRKSMVGSRVI